MISKFWLALLETIYLPIYNFFGYNAIISFVVLILFVAMQIWVFWHFFFKSIIYICKIFVNFINKNTLFDKGVEIDEKNSKKHN
jgi:hypothetical protein